MATRTGHRIWEDRDVRTVRTSELTATHEIVNFVDEVEELYASLQCELLDTLTPEQFAKVQRLVEAGQVMTEAQCMLGVLSTMRASEPVRASACRTRRAIRRGIAMRGHNSDIRAIGA